MSRHFLFDLETAANITDEKRERFIQSAKYGNLKDPAKIEAKIKEHVETCVERAALDPLSGRIVAFSCHVIGSTSFTTVVNLDPAAEIHLIDDLLTEWQGSKCDAMIGFNIRSFDLPFLFGRMLAHGSRCGLSIPRPKDYRQVIDMRDWLPEGKLAHWLAECGLPSKGGDGSDVAKWVEAGDSSAIKDYSSQEIRSMALLVNRLVLATGGNLV